jgi:hypothetical protein
MRDQSLESLASIIEAELLASENRERPRSEKAQTSFSAAVRYLLRALWTAYAYHPDHETSVNLRNGFYSEMPRYNNEGLTYRQFDDVFRGMQHLKLIRITRKGYLDRKTGLSELTRIAPTKKLTEEFHKLNSEPAIVITPNIDAETILLKDENKKLIDYEDTPETREWRHNLRKINHGLANVWPDLFVSDEQFQALQERLKLKPDRQPIDFSKRTLVRIFSNNSWREGGRFYRGWWQNVPSDMRQFITIDYRPTGEADFSQLNPHLAYAHLSATMGSEDAYSRVFDGEHRSLVKEAFNAMLQASRPLNTCPKDINLNGTGIKWDELRDAILRAHKPIETLFFRGIGNRFQFKDSKIAEAVMLDLSDNHDLVTLPVHDSFIANYDRISGGLIEEAMRRAFFEETNTDISIDNELAPIKRALIGSKGTFDRELMSPNAEKYERFLRRKNCQIKLLSMPQGT